LKARFYHPKMATIVRAHIRSCDPCQFYSMSRPNYEFDAGRRYSDVTRVVAVDFAGPFPID